jgi:transposase-like protein
MGKLKQKRVKREYLITLKSKERYRWYMQINRLIKKGVSVKAACKLERIGRSEYYYWDRRIKEITKCMQLGSLTRSHMFRELSNKPHISPKQISSENTNLIVKIRKKTNTGAEYISYILLTKYRINISTSGVYKVLKREGLIKAHKYHQKKKPTFIKRDYKPGEKIQIDTKYVKIATGKTYYQFSAIDVATGIIFKRLYENMDPRSSCNFVREVVSYYPFKIHKIQTDNGFEYTWRLNPDIHQTHPFTLQCQLFGIEHILIPPASPTFNSHVERTHRNDKLELWNKKRYYSLLSMQKDLKKYVSFYNLNRATKSKDWLSPVDYSKKYFGLNITKLCYRVQDL